MGEWFDMDTVIPPSVMSINLSEGRENIPKPINDVNIHILPLVDILGKISPEMAEIYRLRKHMTPKQLAMAELVSVSTNMALRAWATVLINPNYHLSEQDLLNEAIRRNCFENRTDSQDIPDLAMKMFIQIAPYVRQMIRHDNKMINTINWSDSEFGDILLEVSYIRIW